MTEFRTSDGLKLDYRDSGTGPAVLCLPGLTRDLSDFDELASATIGIRLIRLTLRGRNGSDFDPNFRNYSVPQETRDVIEFMDFLNLPSAILIGTSRGGLISMVIGATVPERVDGILLNDIGPVLDPVGLGRIQDYLGVTPKARDLDSLVAGLKSNMAAEFPDLPDSKWRLLAQRWFAVGEDVTLNYDPKMRDAMLEQAPKTPDNFWSLFDLLCDVPLAALRGENSDLLSRDTVAQMQARRPDLIYAEIPNRGHVPFLDEPESITVFQQLLKASK